MDKLESLRAFDALSQETRLDVLRLLIQAGPRGVPAGEIGERLEVRQNTMSVNLGILAQAGLVTRVREGRTVRYAANFDAIQGLVLFLMKDCCGGRPDLCQPVMAQMACGC
ncbi:MAG: helix-turn-helix transcriptional regulator [Asticcacaulis sp.]|nr:helix-turn-helix transcriptional regulator [Asticcacaulis sp.]